MSHAAVCAQSLRRHGRALAVLLFLLSVPVAYALFPLPEPVLVPPARIVPFHVVVELFAVIVAMLVFAVGFHVLDTQRGVASLLLACAFLAVGVLDLLHTLVYPGMPGFVDADSHQTLILWLAARLMAALALLAYFLLPVVPVRKGSRYGLLAAVLLLLGLIIWVGLARPEWVPTTHIPGEGLTPFKIAVEWVVIAMHVATLVIILWRWPGLVDRKVNLLAAALVLSIASGLFFTLYTELSDTLFVFGHVYKVMAYLLIFRGMFLESVREPVRRLEEARELLRQREARIQHEATHDSLTGLPNRRLFLDRLEQAMARVERNGGRIAVLLLDLDNFKEANDRMGHIAGDGLLRELAGRLQGALRRSDTVARFGGDEFVLLLGGIQSEEEAAGVAAKILAVVGEPYTIEHDGTCVPFASSASIGVALYPDHGHDADALLRHADEAMYSVKKEGRNGWRVHACGTVPAGEGTSALPGKTGGGVDFEQRLV